MSCENVWLEKICIPDMSTIMYKVSLQVDIQTN